MVRKIIQIDRERCNGCGACAQACHEGAIGMVDGLSLIHIYAAPKVIFEPVVAEDHTGKQHLRSEQNQHERGEAQDGDEVKARIKETDQRD